MYTHPDRFMLQSCVAWGFSICVLKSIIIASTSILILTNILLINALIWISYVVSEPSNYATVFKLFLTLNSKRFWNRNINTCIKCKSVLTKLNQILSTQTMSTVEPSSDVVELFTNCADATILEEFRTLFLHAYVTVPHCWELRSEEL